MEAHNSKITLGGQIMKKTEKKQFKELSEEQLKEVTGGRAAGLGMCDIDFVNCPSGKFDKQCNCIG